MQEASLSRGSPGGHHAGRVRHVTEGDGNASGEYAIGETVTVYTFARQAAMNAARERNRGFAPTSSYEWATGHLFAVQITAVYNEYTNSSDYSVSPQAVAGRVGGMLVSGS
jgi:hypothetical protein